ncbi:MAG: NAD(P)/FAD-dependent oxidoreductase [Candidatus Zixiibacteriota bacterium]
MKVTDKHRIVIVGGGFGGLEAAKGLRKVAAQVTLVDRRNFHLFQPLLYQVATGGLSPGDICSPLRSILKHHKNTQVLLGEVVDIDPRTRRVTLGDGEILSYDTLVLATGASHDYFGQSQWQAIAPGLKSIEDALDIRSRIFLAFETAERQADESWRRQWLTFVVVGGGPTGVELAGALGEIANETLRKDFRRIDPREAHIYVIEGRDRVLSTYPPKLSQKAARSLGRLGVTVITDSLVTAIDATGVSYRSAELDHRIDCRTVLWSAGVKASHLGRLLTNDSPAYLDKVGRVKVTPHLTVPGHEEIFVIGDLTVAFDRHGQMLPGVSPVAMQQGRYVAGIISRRLTGKSDARPFRYLDKGSMATIGRAAAVAEIFGFRLWGYPAWLVWLFLHLMYIVEFENRLLVFVQWAWNYLTKNRGARLITGEHRLPRRD